MIDRFAAQVTSQRSPWRSNLPSGASGEARHSAGQSILIIINTTAHLPDTSACHALPVLAKTASTEGFATLQTSAPKTGTFSKNKITKIIFNLSIPAVLTENIWKLWDSHKTQLYCSQIGLRFFFKGQFGYNTVVFCDCPITSIYLRKLVYRQNVYGK